jgi:hypothetical protein
MIWLNIARPTVAFLSARRTMGGPLRQQVSGRKDMDGVMRVGLAVAAYLILIVYGLIIAFAMRGGATPRSKLISLGAPIVLMTCATMVLAAITGMVGIAIMIGIVGYVAFQAVFLLIFVPLAESVLAERSDLDNKQG